MSFKFSFKRGNALVAGGVLAACLALVASAALAACGGARMARADLTIERASGGAVTISTELALTDEERSQGYMGRKRIPDGTGMLFAFPADERLSFWMKDTPTALSIAYIDSSGRIREIHELIPFSQVPVKSALSLRYALEVPSGWFGRAGVGVGDALSAATLEALRGKAR
jgi:uncharacterized membrane protein (UPF0127 family)